MIYAKTKLKKIPKTCTQCPLSENTPFDDRVCVIKRRPCPLERTPSGHIRYGKPSWCPLTEVGK